MFASLLLLLAGSTPALAGGGSAFGESISPITTLPFAGLLLSIAIIPMVAHDWFEKKRNQLLVTHSWTAPIMIWLLWMIITGHHADAAHSSLMHAVEEYISFTALLGSLFIISGGIVMRGDIEGRPGINTAFLAIGAILSNFIGTTGASMLLIRPMLRTNSQRKNVKHIPLFFIFLVSNIGGAMTPIGDPPLFLGYLRGVPFWWTAEHLWMEWLTVVGILLVAFFILDMYFFSKESQDTRQRDLAEREPISFKGLPIGTFLLLGVIASILLLSPDSEVMDFRHFYAREIAMGILALISWHLCRAERQENGFSMGPMTHVAILFSGIFITMIPAASLLQAKGAALGVTEPWQYFWATGLLSSFLDNAPTYVTFAAMACGSVAECVSANQLEGLAVNAPELLVAISLGAVFMGANSYIGNGPNLMVSEIAKDSGYEMPSFFGYMFWAGITLIPVFIIVTLIYLV